MSIKCPKCHHENPDNTIFCGKCGFQFSAPEKIEVTETMEAPKEELTTGSTFTNRYQIIEELGKGGMGRVYKAYDTEIKEKIALKLLKSEIAANEEIIERFKNEIKTARQIVHKNVGRMYDLGKEKGTYYITMEFVPGDNLKSFIKRARQLTPKTALSIAIQLCEGLGEAHRIGIVHRDLKPQNVMIDKEGNVRIMDFGIARSLHAKGITRAEVIIGTPEYMSPEQVEGEVADQRSDIYSLGVILFEMLTGKVPFEGDTSLSIALKHKSEIPPDPKTLNKQISDAFSRIILKCMQKDRKSRYQNVNDLLLDLKKATEEEQMEKKISETKWKSSIVVLPFADLSQEKDQEYFCDGLAEELINALSKISELRVVARTSAFAFKGKLEDVREIGKKLDVETVLEGSVRKAGNRLRVMVQLINVDGGYHLWSERYDRELEDVFAIQDEITLAVVENLKVRLFRGEKASLTKKYTNDLEAYNLFLKGQFFLNKRTAEGLKKAIQYFEQAIQRDPNYAVAHAGLANSYLLMPIYGPFSPKEANLKAKEAVTNALKIDNNLAEAVTSLALLKLYDEHDWEGAEQEFKRAIKYNPGYAIAHSWYASEYLIIRARADEAIEEMNRALELDPLSLVYNRDFGMIYYYARQYNQAITALNKTIEIETNFIHTHGLLGLVYLEKSMFKETLSELQKEIAISEGSDLTGELWIGIAHARIGNMNKAKEILENLLKRSGQVFVSPYFIATLNCHLKEIDQGFKWLEKAYAESDSWLNFISVDPGVDIIRSDPRFKALLKKMNIE
jgi:serine/threonine protein kinase/tetratricopeptide (TPR) repeat protein